MYFELSKTDQKMVAKKISDLYITVRKKFLVLNKSKKYYTYKFDPKKINCENDEDEESKNKVTYCKYGLVDSRVHAHLLGKETIGVFGMENSSLFLTIDVDIDEIYIVNELIEEILHLGFSYNNILTSASGGKGYHIDIFFDGPVAYIVLDHFFRLLLLKTGLLDYHNKIEIFPRQGRGVKLPLGINFRSKKIDNFCWLMNKSLKPVDNPMLVLDVQKAPKEKIKQITDLWMDEIPTWEEILCSSPKAARSDVRQSKNLTNKSEMHRRTSTDYLKYGLLDMGTRHNVTVGIAVLLRCRGLSQAETSEMLHNWMIAQNPETYEKKLIDCHEDIEYIVKDVFEREYGNVSANTIRITKMELEYVLRAPNYNAMICVLALIVHAQKHRCTTVVAMSYNQIADATGLCQKTAFNIMRVLVDKGLIVESDEKILPGIFGKRNIKHYCITWRVESSMEFCFFKKNYSIRDIFAESVQNLLTKAELKMVSRSVKERLKLKK